MPAKDIYHDAIKSALIKDGWRIIADPYKIVYKDLELYADLAAIRDPFSSETAPIAAERENQKIVVEIKSFVGRSLMRDFHTAVGQYTIYKNLIQQTDSGFKLFLGIDDITYENFFRREGIAFLTKENQISLLIVDIEKEEIVQWIS